MKEAGLNIPKWGVIPQEVLSTIVPKDVKKSCTATLCEFIKGIKIPQSFIEGIVAYFPKDTFFAVRSSAIDEDGNEFSFAGQFESYLFVSKKDLAENIKKV